ncbi:hypothetical protein FRACYDRAFT_249502 [Fragilariopsis cylindrus CCMP1102]|uniref:SET domain-containing protein n=1 Tax=Fragilariopsis cylindrus CCMP1102 TaxID=635003 RepID=A0A1E7ERN5_9STRA|nr:hypothetical protein FRACYDRAFT_249502 [Fragilariopsis cylindrus CCMP1102]|eukprot:OEU08611.1 hypothetical protein FRACYDRAFT_249502 [Fragilariopsis cylindrus CCMP1102]
MTRGSVNQLFDVMAGCIAWQANQNQNKNYKNNYGRSRSRSAAFHQVTLQQSGNNNINVKSRLLLELSSSSSNTVDDNDQQTETETIEPQQQQSSSLGDDNVLNGVKEFESWFSNLSGNTKYCDSNIIHTSFDNGSLRGLGKMMTSTSASTEDTATFTKWITIPRSIILQSDYRDKDWDSQLAQSLWKEVCKGTGSSSSATSISGYVSLLTRGVCSLDDITSNSCTPPFTAPDALRHWTKDEKDVLLKTNVEKGQKLLDLQIRQEKLWKEKYNTIIGGMTTTTPKMTMTWEQFEWSMEAVHSRAFKGDFGIGGSSSGDGNTGVLPLPVKIGSPVLSAVIGYIYKVVLHGQQDEVLIGLAVLAAIPSIINIFNEFNDSSSSSPVAVLLPLIDSANHDAYADSLIEYNPLTDSFDLSGSELKCLGVKEVDADNSNGSKQQLYISYGTKSPTELLLNYGFLNDNNNDNEDGVSSSGSTSNNQDNNDDDDNDTSTRRKKLAEKFITL